jgi:hypothetical protein
MKGITIVTRVAKLQELQGGAAAIDGSQAACRGSLL